MSIREFIERRELCTDLLRQATRAHSQAGTSVAELARHVSWELAELIAEAAGLQTKARRKFGASIAEPSSDAVYWVTTRSLQQSTPWQVARLKAEWLGDGEIWDLCCGVGGDSMALANRASALKVVDRDEWMVAMTQANLLASDPDRTDRWTTECADATTLIPNSIIAVHIDPDRRAAQTRTVSVNHFQPDWQSVLALVRPCRSSIIKLAPATSLESSEIQPGSHRCWIGLSGSVREQSLLGGEAVDRAGMRGHDRSAVVMAADGDWHRMASTADEGERRVETAAKPQVWMIDPAASVRASGLTMTMAQNHVLQLLGHPSGFFTSDAAELSDEVASMATTGRVLWVGTADDRKLRREFRSRDWYPETIKCRGTDHDPAKLYRRYRQCGAQPVTLWIGKSGQRAYAAVTLG